MKKVITFIALLFIIVSCSTTKKVASSHTTFADSTVINTSTAQRVEKIIDTTRIDNKKVTITEIEFFPPTADDKPDIQADATDKGIDAPKAGTPANPEPKPKSKPATNANVDVLNFGNIKGSVKSIKQTVIESNVEEKGETKDSQETQETENVSSMTQAETQQASEKKPTADPKRWRYIFYIMMLLVAVAAFLYIKRTPFVAWLKKILSGIRKVF